MDSINLTYDFHTHTTYSHGTGSVMENAVSAKEKGLKGIAITDHGFSHPAFGMKRKKVPQMRNDCEAAAKATGIEVLLGIESNILGESGKIDVKQSDYENLDIILAGCHRFVMYDKFKDWFTFFGSNFFTAAFKTKPSEALIKRTTKIYIEAIKNNPIDILTHVNYLVFSDPVEVAKCARDYGTYIEINTKKTHLSDEDWQKVIDTGVNFVIDSDAHSIDRIGDTALAESLFSRVDFPMDRIFNINGRKPDFRFKKFKESM